MGSFARKKNKDLGPANTIPLLSCIAASSFPMKLLLNYPPLRSRASLPRNPASTYLQLTREQKGVVSTDHDG